MKKIISRKYEFIKKAGVYAWSIIGLLIILALLFYAFNAIKGAIIPLLLAMAIAFILGPFIDFMNKKLKNFLSIMIAYFVVAGLLFLILFFGIPTIVNQFQDFSSKVPDYIANIINFINETASSNPILRGSDVFPLDAEKITQYIVNSFSPQNGTLFQNVVDATGLLMNLIIILIVSPVLSVFIVKDSKKLRSAAIRVIPYKYRMDASELLDRINKLTGAYLRGRIFVASIFGVLVYIGLLIFNIDFAYLLAFFAAVASLIPFIGPFIAAIPSVIAAFLVSPLTALWVILFFIGLQFIENYLIEPFIMKEQIHLHPGLIIFVLLAGSAAFGFIGLVLSVPLAAILQNILKYFFFERKNISLKGK